MINIRHAVATDAEKVNEIGNHYIENSVANFKIENLTVQERIDWIKSFQTRGRYQLFVAQEGKGLLGYAASSRYHEREAYETSVMTTVYVHPNACGNGLGTSLYTHLFKALEKEDLNRAFAGITLPNPASVALHRKFGFKNVGVFSQAGRKHDQYWDVLWMEKAL